MHTRLSSSALTALLGACAFAATACATTGPPSELVEARQAMALAEEREASVVAPLEFEKATDSLAEAEAVYEARGNDLKAHRFAHFARRDAQRASQVAFFALYEDPGPLDIRTASADRARELRPANGAPLRLLRPWMPDAERRVQAEAEMDPALRDLRRVAMILGDHRGIIIRLGAEAVFASGSAAIDDDLAAHLEPVATWLAGQPARRVTIEGHADDRGARADNLALSMQRAEAVRVFLAERGIDADRVTTIGYGESRPVMANTDDDSRRYNRRVEFVLTPTLPEVD